MPQDTCSTSTKLVPFEAREPMETRARARVARRFSSRAHQA
ncbi:hypothetical protein AKJ09_00553 [Labilithrix luteola]|uniref:Uncharacterized protein n=1 Tax=Labilithrix luteola TaxID=1391654 RepID=A0A0K1PL95_9BACT|nr:hypothetical protein AKJ09_00553 [Labilithrix luteola]